MVRREENKNLLEIAMKVPGLNTKYLMESYARQFDWLDPKLLFPGEGPGRSPEKAMQFPDYQRMVGQQVQGGGQMSQQLGGM
jgi:hypothetical protein